MYLHANNLSGWAMMHELPVGGVHWVDVSIDQVLATPNGNIEGYVVKVDLEYSEYLHNSHSNNPTAPEDISIPEAWLGDYQHTLVNDLGGKFTENVKLVPNLRK